MAGTDLKRLKGRLAVAHADVEGRPSARELEIAVEEIEALWDELGRHADRLASERERNAALFDRAPFACLITDIHGNVHEANLAAVALLDVPAGYLFGKPLAIFIADEEREAFRMHLAMAVRDPHPIEGWLSRIKSPDGQPREVKIDLRPMPPDAENFLPLLWFLRDIE
ncbi:MAG TPA: PAS domain-containing protein [Burkholderiales bacterium]|nr:PAS domain-containing protein [Burkholderiales bacterium]